MDGKLAKQVAESLSSKGYNLSTPMSALICQPVVAAGRNPHWLSAIRVTDGMCEVRRGAANIPPDNLLGGYTGHLGHWISELRLAEDK